MTAANNAVGPSATNAIRIRGTQSTSNTQKSYFYMKIYVGVSFSVISSRYLQYDIWIDPSSPSRPNWSGYCLYRWHVAFVMLLSLISLRRTKLSSTPK